MNDTHDPSLRSWVEPANSPGTDFPPQNLPFGVFRSSFTQGGPEDPQQSRIGVAVGDQIVDLIRCREAGMLNDLPERVQIACGERILNPLMALGPEASSMLRRRLIEILRAEATPQPQLLVPMDRAQLLVPLAVGGYTDFYASIDHARNVGSLFRPDHPLLPNYKFVPIAYHGRTSSIVVSGTMVRRPHGQLKGSTDSVPSFGLSARLDYEAEIAFAIGTGNQLGEAIPIDDAERHVFGFCLLNDWSARDIQAWEYQPLGPFLGKNFATTISPWVVTTEALEPFRSSARLRPAEDPSPLPYLSPGRSAGPQAFDITVEVFLRSAEMRAKGIAALRLSRGSFRDMYWTVSQMVAHHTSNGCNLTTGDLLASGTVSGRDEQSRGCLLEITRGSKPITLPTGETRVFLSDGDEVTLRAFCERAGYRRIGFGSCVGTVTQSTQSQSHQPQA